MNILVLSNTLASIASACGQNNAPGFYQDIKIAYEEDIETIPDATDGVVSGDITLKTGKSFFTFKVSKNEQEFKVTVEGDEDSNSKKTNCKFFIAKSTSEKAHILGTNSNACPLIALVQDKNDNWRIIGKLRDGAYLKAEEQLTPKNGYVCELYSDAAHFPYFYTGAIPS